MPVYRGSWYSQLPAFGWFDPQDRPGSNALGVPDQNQGIALPSRRTLGQWFNVTDPRGQSHRLQQTDIGPAKWTGRGVDISAAAAHQMGYTPKSFPTDASFTVEPADGDSASMPARLTQGSTMPNSLMDLYGRQQQPTFQNGVNNFMSGGMANSLIGLGMGLMGGGGWGDALRGFQSGAQADAAAQARRQAQLNFERQFARSGESDLDKMQRDIAKHGDVARQYYASKLGEGPPNIQKIYDPESGEEVSATWDRQSRRWVPVNLSGQAPSTTAPAATPFAPGQGVGYGQAGQGQQGFGSGTTGYQGGPTIAPPAEPVAPGTPMAGGGPAAMPPRIGPKAFEPEQKLRKEFEDSTKAYREVRDSYNRVLSSRDDAAGDLSLIFGFMKMLDPGSVVRETEFANAQNAAGVPDRIRNLWNRALSGERLTPGQREQFKGQAGAIYDRYEGSFQSQADQMRGIARQYRVDPNRVIPSFEPIDRSTPSSKKETASGGGSRRINRERAKAAGYTDAEIDAFERGQ